MGAKFDLFTIKSNFQDLVLVPFRIGWDDLAVKAGKGFSTSSTGATNGPCTTGRGCGVLAASGLGHQATANDGMVEGRILTTANNTLDFRVKNNTGTAQSKGAPAGLEISCLLGVRLRKGLF